MLLAFFIFKAFGFGPMGLGLDFAFQHLLGGHYVFSLIHLLAAKLWFVCFQFMFLSNPWSKLSSKYKISKFIFWSKIWIEI
jgi:hypothetical protein